jgi:hypothetical protein
MMRFGAGRALPKKFFGGHLRSRTKVPNLSLLSAKLVEKVDKTYPPCTPFFLAIKQRESS